MSRIAEVGRSLWRMAVIAAVTVAMTPVGLAAFALGKDPDWGLFHLSRYWCGGILKGCGIRAGCRGLEKLERGRAYVFVSTHGSEWAWLLFTKFIPVSWRAVIRADLRRLPLGGFMAARTGQLFLPPRAGTNGLIDLCRPELAQGHSILLYPEGERPPPDQVREFRHGAFRLAVAARVPVVPVAVVEERPAHRLGPFGRGFGHDPGLVQLLVGDPIEPRSAEAEEAERLRRESQAAILDLMGTRSQPA